MGYHSLNTRSALSKYRNAYILWFLLLLSVAVCAMFVLKAEADVAIFRSDTYREQGTEVVDEDGRKKRIQYENIWTDFSGTIPEGTTPTSITLHLSWSLLDRSEPEVAPPPTPEVTSGQVENTVTNPSEYIRESILDDAAIESIDNPIETQEPTPAQSVVVPEIDTDTDVPLSPVEKQDTEEQELNVPTHDTQQPSDTEGFEQVSLYETFPLMYAQLEERGTTSVSSDASQVVESETIITDPVASSTELVSSLNTDHTSFKVEYSVDGNTWNTVGHVQFSDAHDVQFDLSYLGIESLPSLQIAVRYTVSEDDPIKIIFDSMYVEVAYEDMLTEEVVVPVGPNDNEPNFEVSSIKKDITSENIRAVVLERGGMLEFWYAITDNHSGEVAWNRLNAGGVVDANAPIGIKKRTIFWFDQNQETLFGYTVDTKSLFGVPFENPENKTFLLPFTDDADTAWEASFDSVSNELEFHKASRPSV
jgi:hypothetical protein